MNMKMRIISVDMDGYCGREHHPSPSDKGLVVTVLGMNAWHEYSEEDIEAQQPLGDYEMALDGDVCAYPERVNTRNDLVYCWTCVTADGRTLELMDHEIYILADRSK